MERNNKPLVSIIVPIYNVERYLRKCIDSLINQSYTNIEIILVDDGSPDSCGSICDEYIKKDARIVVIHKKNGGLSDARNVGISKAKGEYISLFDSDDFASCFYVEKFVDTMLKYDADIVCSENEIVSFFDDQEDQVKLVSSIDDFSDKLMNKNEVLKQMLYKKTATGAPDNLYKRHIFDGIEYPVGRLYEDLATTYKTYIKANRIARVVGPWCAYRLRGDSIMRASFSEKNLDSIPITKKLYEDICNYDSTLEKAVSQRCFDANFYVFLQVPSNDKHNQRKLWNEILKYRYSVLKDRDPLVRKRNKIAALTTYLGMTLTHKLGCMMVSRIRKSPK